MHRALRCKGVVGGERYDRRLWDSHRRTDGFFVRADCYPFVQVCLMTKGIVSTSWIPARRTSVTAAQKPSLHPSAPHLAPYRSTRFPHSLPATNPPTRDLDTSAFIPHSRQCEYRPRLTFARTLCCTEALGIRLSIFGVEY